MSKNCIISVACRQPYTDYQKRLIETAEALEVPIIYWTDKYPKNARDHHDSLYGFKIYAFREAFEMGYENVLWLDSPAYLLSDPEAIFSQIEADGHYLVSMPVPLWKHLNKNICNVFKMPVAEVMNTGWELMCGSFIGLNKNNNVLDDWEKYEKQRFFLSAYEDAKQDNWYEGFTGFKHDESFLSFIAYTKGLKVVRQPDGHFQNEKAIVKAEKW